VTKNKIKPKASSKPTQDNAATVTEYLLSHPKFFNEHPHVLTEVHLALDSGTASSLIERQVCVLRMQNHKTRAELHDATENARLNEQLSDKIHRLCLRLLTADTLSTSLSEIISSLNNDFDIKWVNIHLLQDRIGHTPNNLANSVIVTNSDDDEISSHFEKLECGEIVCGQLNSDQIHKFFGQHDAIASAALLPLQATPAPSRSLPRAEHGACPVLDTGEQALGVQTFGVIGLGCTREDRFRRDLGTVFLTRIAELISHKLWLDLNAK